MRNFNNWIFGRSSIGDFSFDSFLFLACQWRTRRHQWVAGSRFRTCDESKMKCRLVHSIFVPKKVLFFSAKRHKENRIDLSSISSSFLCFLETNSNVDRTQEKRLFICKCSLCVLFHLRLPISCSPLFRLLARTTTEWTGEKNVEMFRRKSFHLHWKSSHQKNVQWTHDGK